MTAELLRQATPQPVYITRQRIGPSAVGWRYAGIAITAIAVGALHLSHRPATLCPFRALTGIPCPLCGGTTAAADLGRGEIGRALGASPLAIGMLATWPLLGTVRPPAWWHSERSRRLVIAGVIIASEIWQLVRFGIIRF